MQRHVDVLLLRIIRHPLEIALKDDNIISSLESSLLLARKADSYMFSVELEANLLQHDFGNRPSGIDVVYLQVRGLNTPKPFDTGPSRSRRFIPHLATLIRIPCSIF